MRLGLCFAPTQVRLALRLIGAALSFVLGVGMAAEEAGAADALRPHEATYELQADPNAVTGGGTIDARMRFSLARTCAGWHTRAGIEMVVSVPNGGRVTVAQRFDSLEAFDGGSLTSTVSMSDGTTPPTTLTATAKRRTDGGVDVVFGSGKRASLPRGTLFAMQHLAAQIAAAQGGQTLVRHIIFDGNQEEAMEVSTVIGRARPAAGASRHRGDPLPDSWLFPLRMAYFQLASKAADPVGEISATAGVSGITAGITLDFGGLRFDGRLTELKLLAPDRC